MKIIYVNNLKRKVQQGTSFSLDLVKGSIKVGDFVDDERLWEALPKTKTCRTITDIEIEDYVIYAVISGKTLDQL